MVKSMTASLNIPHFGYCDEIHMDALVQLRKDMNDAMKKHGVKFSYLPMIIKVNLLFSFPFLFFFF